MMATMQTAPQIHCGNGYIITELSVHRDVIPVSMMHDTYKPDPTWTHTDRRGHHHARVGTEWPTLTEFTVTRRYWDDYEGAIEYTEVKHMCTKCREVIEPGMIVDQPAGVPRYIPGLTTVTVCGVIVAPEAWGNSVFVADLSPWLPGEHRIEAHVRDSDGRWSGYAQPVDTSKDFEPA